MGSHELFHTQSAHAHVATLQLFLSACACICIIILQVEVVLCFNMSQPTPETMETAGESSQAANLRNVNILTAS